MARVPVNVITVSPPNLDRTGFLSLEMGIGRQDGPTRRDWLLDRFEEGFQVRMLRPPLKGFVEFAPGRVSWKPLIGGTGCIVVQSLCVKSRIDWSEGAGSLLQSAETWARYYDFAAVLLPLSAPTDPETRRGLFAQGYRVIDETAGGIALWAKVVQGPLALPGLPQDWHARAERLGSGLVVQTVGHCDQQLRRGYDLVDMAREAGLEARLEPLHSTDIARERLVTPKALFAVVLEGEVIDCGRGSTMQVWHDIRRRSGL